MSSTRRYRINPSVEITALGSIPRDVKPPAQAATGRVCQCGTRLSRYNLDTLCCCCQHQQSHGTTKEN